MSVKFIKQKLQEWNEDYTLHNLPAIQECDRISGKICKLSIVSVYELQKSAANWSYADFKKNKPRV